MAYLSVKVKGVLEKRKTTSRWFARIIRHLASFPQSSIIAATGLDFCVRNENRYFPSAMGTESALLFKKPRSKALFDADEILMIDFGVLTHQLLAKSTLSLHFRQA